jgi:DNA-binding MarR family transcriptional regulator
MNASDRQELAERLYALTTHLVRNSGSSATTLIDEIGVRPSQLKALHIATYAEAPLTVSRLAELLDVSQPTASRLVAALSRQGLVECAIGPEDRRARHITATAAGLDVVRRLAAARIADLTVFTDRLSDAKAHRLAAALSKLDLAADDEPASAPIAA